MTNFTPYLGPLLPAVIGGVIGGSVVLYNRRKSRVQTAKDAFGVFIREKLGELPKREVAEFYAKTKPGIRDAVQRVGHYLTREKRTRLERAWKDYDEIPAQVLDRRHEGAMGEAIRDLHKVAGAEFQSPYEIVKFYLDLFYEFSA